MSVFDQINKDRIPQHVAVIMDGNGRWAKARGLERVVGHQEGVDSVDKVTEAASELGIKYLTIYAFSTENWNRPKAEVDRLMELIAEALLKYTVKLKSNNVRLRIIGEMEKLTQKAQDHLNASMKETEHCTGLSLVIALSYSSRWEMTEAIKKMAADAQAGMLEPSEIDDKKISQYLTTAGMPDPDLLIRTSGELRISNFLLWQIAYSELYFTDICWPDFKKEAFYEAILDYQKRERRFGKTSEQIS